MRFMLAIGFVRHVRRQVEVGAIASTTYTAQRRGSARTATKIGGGLRTHVAAPWFLPRRNLVPVRASSDHNREKHPFDDTALCGCVALLHALGEQNPRGIVSPRQDCGIICGCCQARRAKTLMTKQNRSPWRKPSAPGLGCGHWPEDRSQSRLSSGEPEAGDRSPCR